MAIKVDENIIGKRVTVCTNHPHYHAPARPGEIATIQFIDYWRGQDESEVHIRFAGDTYNYYYHPEDLEGYND